MNFEIEVTHTSIPSLSESNKSENTVINSDFIKRFRKRFTSATFPTKPIIFRNNSSLSWKHCKWKENDFFLFGHFMEIQCLRELTCKQLKKYVIPPPFKKRSQFIAVSSVTFHIVDQATSITSSNTFRFKRSWIKVNIVWMWKEINTKSIHCHNE